MSFSDTLLTAFKRVMGRGTSIASSESARNAPPPVADSPDSPLSQSEKLEVEEAIRAFREGSLHWDPASRTDLAPSALPGSTRRLMGYLVELESGDPRRIRRLLANGNFKACVINEAERDRSLQGMHYYASVPIEGGYYLKRATEFGKEDWARFVDSKILTNTPEGLALRAEHFPHLDDDYERWEAARFCKIAAQELSLMVHPDDPTRISDQRARECIFDGYVKRLSHIEDEEGFKGILATIGRMSFDMEPRRIMHYADIFKRDDWPGRVVDAWHALNEKRRSEAEKTEAAKLERERVQLAESRKKVERQLSFVVEGEVLDISVHGWPKLEDPALRIPMFQNLKAAFARATRVGLLHIPRGRGDTMKAERSILSMAPRQLACVKNALWEDRMGIVGREDEDQWARHLISLLNADGRATLHKKDDVGRFVSLYPFEADLFKTDIEAEWMSCADVYQKWIDTDTFTGELARWIVEDPSNNTGWATSR
ncbi:hypothetical protein WI604_03845 [Bradyrhizobium symbiodeficiens]|uniref:hypothetical protein n=1 Tax=Bradyrhizobium symbiodeficiens TaxID=1404367 RepID=UPI0030D0891F